MKAKALEKQQAVQLHEQNGKDYIQIYVNETEGDEEQIIGEETYTNHYYEYDFTEIIVPHGTLDISEIQKDPATYLDYKPIAEPTIADLQEALTALQEIVLGGEE